MNKNKEFSCKNCELFRKECSGHLDCSPCENYKAKEESESIPILNYKYTRGIGHYKDCPVCIGECICP